MLFQSKQIKGIGRGHEIGFPTINLEVPKIFDLDQGIYAAWVVINNKTYKGALHYGSIPTFDLEEKTLEVHLLDMTDEDAPDTDGVEIETDIVEKLRDIKNFDSVEELSLQISKDVKNVGFILK